MDGEVQILDQRDWVLPNKGYSFRLNFEDLISFKRDRVAMNDLLLFITSAIIGMMYRNEVLVVHMRVR